MINNEEDLVANIMEALAKVYPAYARTVHNIRRPRPTVSSPPLEVVQNTVMLVLREDLKTRLAFIDPKYWGVRFNDHNDDELQVTVTVWLSEKPGASIVADFGQYALSIGRHQDE